MVTLRPTRKLQGALVPSRVASASDTALGDWYVNRLVVDKRPLLLLVSSKSLLPIVLPARDIRTLPHRLADIVALRLTRLGIPASLIAKETAAMNPVEIGPTTDRSVLGIMVDFAKGAPYYLEAGNWDDSSLTIVEERLSETPCYASSQRTIFPNDAAPRLLAEKWLGIRSRQV